MNNTAFYMTGLAELDTDGSPRAMFATDSVLLAEFIAEHAHEPIVLNVDPSPLPLVIHTGVVEGDVILTAVNAAGHRWLGHLGRMGYALQRERGYTRVIVGEPAVADWLRPIVGVDHWLQDVAPVRAMSGNVGWVFHVDRMGARRVDACLSAIAATRVMP